VITFKVKDSAWKDLERVISRKVAEVTARAASIAYNTAISYSKPRWSGEFRASWEVNWNHPSSKQLEHAKNISGKPSVTHVRPYEQSVLPNYGAPFSVAYVSNAAPHAYQVENVGTPTHLEGGCKIALHSKNQTVQRLRLF